MSASPPIETNIPIPPPLEQQRLLTDSPKMRRSGQSLENIAADLQTPPQGQPEKTFTRTITPTSEGKRNVESRDSFLDIGTPDQHERVVIESGFTQETVTVTALSAGLPGDAAFPPQSIKNEPPQATETSLGEDPTSPSPQAPPQGPPQAMKTTTAENPTPPSQETSEKPLNETRGENPEAPPPKPIPEGTAVLPPPVDVPGRNWWKIAGIVTAVITGIISAFALLCLSNSFPAAFLGGKIGCCCVLGPAGLLFVGSGVVIWMKWSKPPVNSVPQ